MFGKTRSSISSPQQNGVWYCMERKLTFSVREPVVDQYRSDGLSFVFGCTFLWKVVLIQYEKFRLHSVLFWTKKTTNWCKICAWISNFFPYRHARYYLWTSKPLCTSRITFCIFQKVQFSVEFFALLCLRSPISEGSQKIGPPPVLEASLDIVDTF